MALSTKPLPDLSSNVLKLSFMRPTLKAYEKSKIIKNDNNPNTITFPLPEDILDQINKSLKKVKSVDVLKTEKNILSCSKLPRGLRLSYGGFNLDTEKQMMRKEINVDDYDDDDESQQDCTVSVEEMSNYLSKNRKRSYNKLHNNEIEEGEIISESRLKRRK